VQQHELRPSPGARKRRKRVGRGNASGHGTYAGKGLKGQQARSGKGPHPGFEGGQTPLIRRLPRRRGFHNPFRVEFTLVNLKDLSKFAAGSEVTPESLRETGTVRTLQRPIKLLGDGDMSAALTVRVHRVSAAARAKIEAAGGTVEELAPRVEKQRQRKHLREAAKAKAKAKEEAGEAEKTEKAHDSDSETSESASAE
jgi:large subunit ribosomal protein L15